MKTAIVVLVLLSFLTFALIDAAPDPVLDIFGEKILTGTNYFILPAIRGRSGGLTLGITGNKTCAVDAVQAQLETDNGLPLTLHPVNMKKGVVRVAADLNLQFSVPTICNQSKVWKLDNFDETLKQWFVTTGGVLGNPGPKTTSNWFKILKAEDHYYKLVFCPTVCHFGKVPCRYLGIFIDGGVRRLALSDEPFIVKFKKQI